MTLWFAVRDAIKDILLQIEDFKESCPAPVFPCDLSQLSVKTSTRVSGPLRRSLPTLSEAYGVWLLSVVVVVVVVVVVLLFILSLSRLSPRDSPPPHMHPHSTPTLHTNRHIGRYTSTTTGADPYMVQDILQSVSTCEAMEMANGARVKAGLSAPKPESERNV